MAKPQKKATATAKAKTVSKTAAKKQVPTRRTHKRKPADESTDSEEESSDTEPPPKPRKKRAKRVVDDEMDVVNDRDSVEPEEVSNGDRDDARSSDEVRSWDYSRTQRLTCRYDRMMGSQYNTI